MIARPLRLPGLAFGGDYNPEQWPEEVWAEDVRLMRDAGVNLVTLPVFGWSRLEPEPGRYDFGWLDRVIELLWSAEIRVDLATATATPPPWLVRKHPGVLPVTAGGVRLEFGSRQGYCPSSPVFAEYALRLTEAMARRYGEHDALALWHVSNEYGDHLSRCYCPVTADHFRRWLRDRYGELAALNDAWGTTCWGQLYGAWEEVEVPRTATGPSNPAQRLDFERFSSDALLELFRAEVEVLRRITPEVPVTTNFMSLFRDLDYWAFAEVEDLVTDDAYPDPADERAHVHAALNYGLMRSLKAGQPWLLLEQAPSAVSWREVNLPKAPGQMRMNSLQAIAHGSDGAMFFQWRAARFGPERFHSAMLGHRGERSRSWRETRALGRELSRLAEVAGSRVVSRVALVVDWDAWWGLDAPDSMPSLRLDWLAQARMWHAALHDEGLTVDAVRATGPFDDYDLVVAPNLYVLTEAAAAGLTTYVRNGGRLVVGPFSGVVDADDRVHPGGAPGPLRELLGVEVEEWWPVLDGSACVVEIAGTAVAAETWSEWIIAEGNEVLGVYRGGVLDGRPAVTRRIHGHGEATYVSVALDEDGMRFVLRHAARGTGLAVATPVPGVEIVVRRGDDAAYTFVLNHGADVAVVELTAGLDLLSGEPVAGAVKVPPQDALVVRTPHEPAEEN